MVYAHIFTKYFCWHLKDFWNNEIDISRGTDNLCLKNRHHCQTKNESEMYQTSFYLYRYQDKNIFAQVATRVEVRKFVSNIISILNLLIKERVMGQLLKLVKKSVESSVMTVSNQEQCGHC